MIDTPTGTPAAASAGPESGQTETVAAGRNVTVRLPAALRRLAGEQSAVHVVARAAASDPITVGDVLSALESTYPGLHHATLDERGVVRTHVNVFVGTENIRLGAGLATPVAPGVEVWILPAVSGG